MDLESLLEYYTNENSGNSKRKKPIKDLSSIFLENNEKEGAYDSLIGLYQSKSNNSIEYNTINLNLEDKIIEKNYKNDIYNLNFIYKNNIIENYNIIEKDYIKDSEYIIRKTPISSKNETKKGSSIDSDLLQYIQKFAFKNPVQDSVVSNSGKSVAESEDDDEQEISASKNQVRFSHASVSSGIEVPVVVKLTRHGSAQDEIRLLEFLKSIGHKVPVVHSRVGSFVGGEFSMQRIPGLTLYDFFSQVNTPTYLGLRINLLERVMKEMKAMQESIPSQNNSSYSSKLPETFEKMFLAHNVPLSRMALTNAERIGEIWDTRADKVLLDRTPRNVIMDYVGVLSELSGSVILPSEIKTIASKRKLGRKNIAKATEYLKHVYETSPELVVSAIANNLYHVDFDTVNQSTASIDNAVLATDFEVAAIPYAQRRKLHSLVAEDSTANSLIAFGRNIRLAEAHYNWQKEGKNAPDPAYNLRCAVQYLSKNPFTEAKNMDSKNSLIILGAKLSKPLHYTPISNSVQELRRAA